MSEQEKEQKGAEPELETGEEQQAAADADAEQAEPTTEEKLAEADAELAKVKKALAEADVRAQAEVQNVRKRAERDVQHARKFALEKFAGDLLSVADNGYALSRAAAPRVHMPSLVLLPLLSRVLCPRLLR